MLYQTYEKPTKVKIIEAAFSFYTEPRYTDLSLSAIAAKVGISKTAIFRHFKNKEDLFSTMEQFLFDRTADNLRAVQAQFGADCLHKTEGWRMLLEKTIFMLASHAEYIWFIKSIFVSHQNTDVMLFRELRKRGLDLYSGADVQISEDGNRLRVDDPVIFFSTKYVINTLFFIIGEAALHHPEKLDKDHVKEFAATVARMFEDGIYEKEDWLSVEQMAQIDSKCCLDVNSLPPEDPVFVAISKVVRKKGIPHVTVESVAAELGLAKSSLYTYFSSKSEMMSNLIEKEISALVGYVGNAVKNITSPVEIDYGVIRAEMSFFKEHPSFIPVACWLHISGSLMPDGMMKGMNEVMKNETVPYIRRFSINRFFLSNWLGVLSSLIFLHTMDQELTDDQMLQTIKQCFMYIQRGLGFNRADASLSEV